MDFEKIYEDFYSMYYIKIESLIKKSWITRKREKKTFGNAISEVQHYLKNDFINKYSLKSQNLEKLYQIFRDRHRIYEIDEIQEIFKNDIKKEFTVINASDLPKDFTYTKFIKRIALLEVEYEISRLLTNNSTLLEMFYKLNEFDEFEIKYYRDLSLEHYPIYKKLNKKLYPEYYDNLNNNENLVVIDYTLDSAIIKQKNIFNRNHWNGKCFSLFNYLVDNYEKKGKVKYINIFYFLRDNVDTTLYVFRFTIEEYSLFVQSVYDIKLTTFRVAEYEFQDKEIPVMRSLEEDFREQV